MSPTILTMGLNHTTAPIQVREQIALAQCKQSDTVAQLSRHFDPGCFIEMLVLSTCNRTEVYGLVAEQNKAENSLRRIFALDESQLGIAGLYSYSDREAVSHLFSVASGIDSMVIGESEILGQVRTAYLNAAEANTVGPVLHHLFKDAIHTGKRAHSETNIGNGPQSIAYAAVSLARQLLGSLDGKNVLIIGAGEMAQRAAKDLAADVASMVMVTNRTFARAAELAQQINGRAVGFDSLDESLAKADLVISATGAPHILLGTEAIRRAAQQRSSPLLLIDISVPRNISPDAGTVPNVTLKNIDDLFALTDSVRLSREQSIRDVKGIIAEETQEFWNWFMERKAAPTIGKLHHRAEEIRLAELDKALRRLGHLHLTDRDRNVIAALSAGIVNKLLAAPTANLKERAQSGDGEMYLATLRELFDLDGNENTEIPTAL